MLRIAVAACSQLWELVWHAASEFPASRPSAVSTAEDAQAKLQQSQAKPPAASEVPPVAKAASPTPMVIPPTPTAAPAPQPEAIAPSAPATETEWVDDLSEVMVMSETTPEPVPQAGKEPPNFGKLWSEKRKQQQQQE